MSEYTKTHRSRVRRLAGRGVYDRETIHAIVDGALVCHVAFVVDGEPRVLPTAIARIGDAVYLHGNRNSQMLRALESGARACISVTHLDGIVVARSGFHCSMNYRSVVVHAAGRKVEQGRKRAVLDTFVERLVPGLNADLRPVTDKELDATTVLEFDLTESSAKVRHGPPIDDDEDYARDSWAGVIPIALQAGPPVDDPDLRPGIEQPGYIADYARRLAGEDR
jgi:nitroimidazol reductase NimA-like FMN-containing flavoprotein (pyridoxamine 5'-phosphate oxidase superfamily)